MKPWAAKYWSEDNEFLSDEVAPSSNKVIKLDFITSNNIKYSWSGPAHKIKKSGDKFIPPADRKYRARLPVPGYNTLFDVYPHLKNQWHPSRNGDTDPNYLLPQSNQKIHWICDKSHMWESSVDNRTKNQSGCPFCAGNEVIVGETDLATVNPELAIEWHPEKNGGLKPSDVSPGSSKKIWWKCVEGHEWTTSVSHRSRGQGCPRCFISRKNSSPETIIKELLSLDRNVWLPDFTRNKSFNSIDGHKTILDKEFFLDYDGSYWHRDMAVRDTRKTRLILDASENHYVIRVREQSRNYKLPFLDISHPRLLQLSSKADEYSLEECAKEIQDWIDKMTE